MPAQERICRGKRSCACRRWSRLVAPGRTIDVARLARLARLELPPAEADALGAACEAIAREFADLAAFAAPLAPPEEERAGDLREDVAADAGEADAILAAAPRIDPGARLVRAPR